MQFVIKIILFILGLRILGCIFQILCWFLFLPVTIVSAATSAIFPELFGGGLLTVLVIGAIAYCCHKNGINPFLALFVLNLADGNRRGNNNRDILFAAGAYEMMKDGDRPRPRYYRDPYYHPYRWYHWHYWW
jgi:hypothetical protein